MSGVVPETGDAGVAEEEEEEDVVNTVSDDGTARLEPLGDVVEGDVLDLVDRLARILQLENCVGGLGKGEGGWGDWDIKIKTQIIL